MKKKTCRGDGVIDNTHIAYGAMEARFKNHLAMHEETYLGQLRESKAELEIQEEE